MMISPESYIEMLEKKNHDGLLKEREYLIMEIREFEKNKGNEDNLGICHPSPKVRYQMNLQYLGKL